MFKRIEELKEKNEPSINHKLLEEYPGKQYEDPGLDLSKLTVQVLKYTT